MLHHRKTDLGERAWDIAKQQVLRYKQLILDEQGRSESPKYVYFSGEDDAEEEFYNEALIELAGRV